MVVHFRRGFLVGLRLLAGVVIAGMVDTAPVHADNDGTAFLGGIMAGHALSRFGEMQRQRNEELALMARGGGGGYGGENRSEPPAPQYQAPPMTPEQKLNQLNKLAAGGYITPQEYKERRQAILNSL